MHHYTQHSRRGRTMPRMPPRWVYNTPAARAQEPLSQPAHHQGSPVGENRGGQPTNPERTPQRTGQICPRRSQNNTLNAPLITSAFLCCFVGLETGQEGRSTRFFPLFWYTFGILLGSLQGHQSSVFLGFCTSFV